MTTIAETESEPRTEAAAGARAAGADEPRPRWWTSAWLRSPAVVVATIALSVGVALVQSSLAGSVLRGLLIAVVVPCSVIDLEHRIIPNRITGPAALTALALGLALDPSGQLQRLEWTAAIAGFLLVAALISPAGMGMGDVKLLGVIGLLLGRPVVIALFVALACNVVTGVVLAHRHGIQRARKTGLAFGPYLALGALVAALVG